MLFVSAPHDTSAKHLLLPLALVLSLALGCGGNVVVDHGGNGQGGAGGMSSSSSPSMFGTPQAACILHTGGLQLCEQLFDAPPILASELKTACGQSNGMMVAACGTDGLLGCCAISAPGVGGKLEECFYGGVTVAQAQMACQGQMGSFSTSP